MKTKSRIACGVVLMSLAGASLLLAQVAQPPRPAAGGPAGPGSGFGVPPQGFGTRVLKPRALEDKQLEEKDQKKYESLITSMEKRSTGGRTTAASNSRTTELASAFRLASTQLRYGQEKSARDSFEKAWNIMPELYNDPKTAMAATGQIRTHLKELHIIAQKDPELVITMMTELAPAHTKSFEAIKQNKAKGQLVQPLAQTWAMLMDLGQLDKDAMEKGCFWVLKFPQSVMADRPLNPNARADYDSQLTQVNVNISTKLRELAERQLSGRPGQNLNPNATPETIDPATAQVMTALDAKRGPIMRFMEADVHFKFGQFRRGLEATNVAWKELLEFYRANPGTIAPADTAAHFESLERIAGLNLAQALILLDLADPAYRSLLQADRAFGVKVADNWAKMGGLPLDKSVLPKAVFWLDHVSKQHKDMEPTYATALADFKEKYEQLKGERENDDDDDRGKKDDDADDKNGKEDEGAKEHKGIGGHRGLSVPKTIDSLKRQGN